MHPQDVDTAEGAGVIGRMRLAKSYLGDLVASAKGQVLTCYTDQEGSAGYVAVEVVDGVLDGRQGTFVLQHAGIMNRGQASLDVTIIPDSGTDDLSSISGTMTIDVDEPGRHSYTINYQLK